MDEEVTFQMWDSTDRTSMSTIVDTLEEFIDILCNKIDALTNHSFIAKSQSAFLKKIKEELPEDTAIVICDFAENYQYVIQDEVQSYHWSKEYCTLHPMSIYLRSDQGLQTYSLCILSDDNQHDTPFVYKCQQIAMNYIKENHTCIQNIEYFTDGCGGQYKNFKNFINICHHYEDFGLNGKWNFFATSHGKGPCDGIGGTVKRLAYRESLRRTSSDYIIDINTMFNFCKTIKNIQFHLISGSEMIEVREQQNQRYKVGDTVPGTQSFYQSEKRTAIP